MLTWSKIRYWRSKVLALMLYRYETGYVPHDLLRSDCSPRTQGQNEYFTRAIQELMGEGRLERSIIDGVACYRKNA